MIDKPIRYFTFDYDAGTVIEYEREGECCGCGACCMTMIRWVAQFDKLHNSQKDGSWNSHNGDPWINGADGKYNALFIDGRWRYFKDMQVTNEPHRCKMLTDNNRCKTHLGKGLISRAWPMSPEHVTPFAECSYSFREVGRWTIDDFFEHKKEAMA